MEVGLYRGGIGGEVGRCWFVPGGLGLNLENWCRVEKVCKTKALFILKHLTTQCVPSLCFISRLLKDA